MRPDPEVGSGGTCRDRHRPLAGAVPRRLGEYAALVELGPLNRTWPLNLMPVESKRGERFGVLGRRM